MPPAGDAPARERFLETVDVLASFAVNLAVLKPGDLVPDRRSRSIDIWWRGEKNGSLMALFAYLMTLDPTWAGARIHLLRIVRDDREEREARHHLSELRRLTRFEASIEVIRSTAPAPEIIAERSGTGTDLVFLGMATASGDQARAFFEGMDDLLEKLPTTVLVWSNGEADVFA